MKKVLKNVSKNKVLIFSVSFFVIFFFASSVFATDPPVGGYPAGFTLDPECAPGSSANCTVKPSWSLYGNSNTVDGINFIGTTDNVPLSFIVNNTLSGRIDDILNNTFFGYRSGNNTIHTIGSTGNGNTAIGSDSLHANISGYNNTAIGSGADVGLDNLIDATAIGARAVVLDSYTIQLGDTNITNINSAGTLTLGVGINTIQYPNDHGLVGQVLTTDGSQKATWQDPVSSGWGLTGNSGTIDGTSFIGTTDNVPLTFKVNNHQAGRIEDNVLGLSNTFYGYQSGNNYNGVAGSVTSLNILNGGTGYEGITSSNVLIAAPNEPGGVQAQATPIVSTISQDEIVNLSFSDQPTSGNYTITVTDSDGVTEYTTISLDVYDDSTTVQDALEDLSNVGVGNILVTGDNLIEGGLELHFTGSLTNTPKTITASGNFFMMGMGYSTDINIDEIQHGSLAGVITGFTITEHGSGYNHVPNVMISGGDGHASVTANVDVATGFANTAIGMASLYSNISGNHNIAIGQLSLYSNRLGDLNIAIGSSSLNSNISGSSNVAVGGSSLRANTVGYSNTAIGNDSLYTNSDGYYNIAIGEHSLYANMSGHYNTANGSFALAYNSTGNDNTANGVASLEFNVIGDRNTAYGSQSLINNLGNNNTAVGYGALGTNVNGSNNTVIGYSADVQSGNLINATAIGYGALVGASNSLVLGGTALTGNAVNVGIGTTTPQYALDVLSSGTGVIARFNSTNSTGCTLGTDGTMTCTSDARLKKNIVSLNTELDSLMNLRPVEYNWNYENDSQMKSLGFIAQEVESIFPKLVITDGNGFKELNTIGLTPIMVKSIQELNLKIINMATEIDTNKICLSDSNGGEPTCLDKGKLDEFIKLLNSNNSTSSNSGSTSSSSSSQNITSTCSDGIMNQDETGIDIGGVCTPSTPSDCTSPQTLVNGVCTDPAPEGVPAGDQKEDGNTNPDSSLGTE